MIDDPGDIDRNGIPDALQLDEVIPPGEQAPFSLYVTDPGLPGIDSPIEATADAPAADMPPPVEPTAPPADADEATLMQYQAELQKYNRMFEMYSNIMATSHEMKKALIDNLRG